VIGAESVRASFKLIRLDRSLVGAFGVLVSCLLAEYLRSLQSEYLVAFSIVFLSAVGSFGFDDHYHSKVDKRNERYR
jgi:4-hydroxybenzoate polyprenyltransferase